MATLLDSVMGCAVHSILSARGGYSTVEIKVNYVRPITLEVNSLRAEGRVLHAGRRIVTAEGAVAIKMTLTTPACPVAGSLPGEVERKVRAVPGVTDAKVELVWDPPWDKSRMSEAAQLQLGLFD